MSIFNDPLKDEQLQKELDKMKLVQTQADLRLLALCYTERTKLVPIQTGVRTFAVMIEDKTVYSGYRKLYIPVNEFFGMHIAYCVETDTLAYWQDPLKDKPCKEVHCYICGEHTTPEIDRYFSGYVQPGHILVAMHIACAKEKDIDVCGDCMSIIPGADRVNNGGICKECNMKRPLSSFFRR